MVRTVILMSAFAAAVCLPAVAADNPAGDPAQGAIVFQHCAVCHNADKGGGNRIGPNLFGVVGHKSASLADFSYSQGLKDSKIVWNDAMLRKWVAGPQKVIPGTRMTFPGLTRDEDVDNVIAYLKTRK
jgi:cytochrome c